MIKRLLYLIHARNLEFIRDRSSLGWNIVFPILLLMGLAFVFSGNGKPFFKVAVLSPQHALDQSYHPFFATRYIQFFPVSNMEESIKKVARHQIDMLLKLEGKQRGYWINSQSPKSYLVEKLLLATDNTLIREQTENTPVSYLDWVLPGVLAMNIMFSCLFGVGFVIVRYRKNGYLKRLNATPLTPFEFIVAQMASRLILIMAVSIFLFVTTHAIFQFTMIGSYFDLFIVALLGGISLISLSLLITSRVSNEELAGGLLNLVSWPMMFLSGVWFSLEGSPPLVRHIAEFLPLTHMLDAARAIMIDGKNLSDLLWPLSILVLMSMIFITLGSKIFKWSEN